MGEVNANIFPDLLIRADADPEMGTGHVMRCLAIAQTWENLGGRSTFLGHWKNPYLQERVVTPKIDFIEIIKPYTKHKDLKITLSQLNRLKRKTGQKPWLILDGYHFSDDFQKAIKESNFPLLVLDDTVNLKKYYADIILNPNFHCKKLIYPVSAETLILSGPEFFPLRKEFLKISGRKKFFSSRAKKILITLGGSNQAQLLRKIVKAAIEFSFWALELTVIYNEELPDENVFIKKAKIKGHKIIFLKSVPQMAALMKEMDLIITAAGTTLLEASFLGIPCLTGYLARNQKINESGFKIAGAAISIGSWRRASIKKIRTNLFELILESKKRRVLSKNAKQIVAGKGAHYLSQLLFYFFQKIPPGKIILRLAEKRDCISLWQLANEPAVRANSFNKKTIPLKHHMKWFSARINSRDTIFWVVEFSGVIAGQIRYDKVSSEKALLNFSVSGSFRGKGLGTFLLNSTKNLLFRKMNITSCIEAIVFTENLASKKSFEKAGFQLDEIREIEGKMCFVFLYFKKSEY
ncbi:UDP-2,4-diacetamido-2,4,6-trideoxy-beta-L-altropyranose hydrolase [Candidatus Riflebacteria bacterium]